MKETKNEWDFEKTLADSKLLLQNAARSDEDFTLESILAEFGGRSAAAGADEVPPAPPETAAAPDAPPPSDPTPEPAAPPSPPASLSLEQVLTQTVSAALDEDAPPEEKPPRRSFLRKKPPRPESPPDPEPEPEPEPDVPEPPVDESALSYADAHEAAARTSSAALVTAVLMWIPLLLAHFGKMPALYFEEPMLSLLPYLIAEGLICLLGRDVFVYAAEQLFRGRATYELAAALTALVTLGDGIWAYASPARAALAQAPLCGMGALGMAFALLGRKLLFESHDLCFRIARMGEPAYVISETAGGAAKRPGTHKGFTWRLEQDDPATRWQALLLPLILAATLIYALLVSAQRGCWTLFAWNWSVILSAANVPALALVYALPFARLTRRVSKSGCAVAGWAGAERMCRSNCIILTDGDLFPPGTVSLSGLKIFGEESGKVISFAASMAHASHSGLERLFDDLLKSEGAPLLPVDDLDFIESGGIAGRIRGETVLFGTEEFVRRQNVTLPKSTDLKTGVFLAVDGALIAVFAVKYHAAENVDWALHALKRASLTPVLAVRDANVTPSLLKQRFNTDAHAVYPRIGTRLALSEPDGGGPTLALLLREGLMPFAEAVVGSKRLVRAVRMGNVLSLLGSVAGAQLAYYLTSAGAYSVISGAALLAFALLWTLAALIDALFLDRY